MSRFADREAAGAALADRLSTLLDRGELNLTDDRSRVDPATIRVLALPRGGVPVAGPVARRWGTEVRLLLVRKLGFPGHPELAMGAIAGIGGRVQVVRNSAVLDRHPVDSGGWDAVLADERTELERRMEQFEDWTAAAPAGAPVLLVDDGLATGSTMQAAIAAVRAAGSGPVIAAVPVASAEAADRLAAEPGTTVVCLSRPDPMIAVGEAYGDFRQVDDGEVLRLLRATRPD